MSLINDALKQARQTPPRDPPHSRPPLHPAEEESRPVTWLVPVIVLILIVAAIFFIGWLSAHHAVQSIMVTPDTVVVTQEVPATVQRPVTPPAPEPPVVVNPPDAPVLQGIFYSPTKPSAIVDGKTIRPGDPCRQYKVKAITQYAVILVGPDKKEIRLGMDR